MSHTHHNNRHHHRTAAFLKLQLILGRVTFEVGFEASRFEWWGIKETTSIYIPVLGRDDTDIHVYDFHNHLDIITFKR